MLLPEEQSCLFWTDNFKVMEMASHTAHVGDFWLGAFAQVSETLQIMLKKNGKTKVHT